MKILMISSHGLYREFSASFVHQQARAMVEQGHQVMVLIPYAVGKRGMDRRRVGPGVLFHQQDGVLLAYMRCVSLGNLGSKHFNTPSTLAALRLFLPRILGEFRPDILHAHTLGYCSEIGAYLKKRLGLPLVVTTHGGDTNTPLDMGRKADLRHWCSAADYVVACSRVLAQRLASCDPQVPVSYIWNGFSAGNRTDVPKISGRIVQVSNLVSVKHTALTLRAAARVMAHNAQVTLTVVGDGPEHEGLEALCRELQITHRVHFTGFLPNPDALAQMAQAEIFVMPSYPEGFGIVYLEAMASGCVTIGTAGEGIDGVIVSGENGFLVPRDDVDAIASHIDDCFRDPALRQRIAEAGRRTAMGLTWEKNAKQYIDLFQKLNKKIL